MGCTVLLAPPIQWHMELTAQLDLPHCHGTSSSPSPTRASSPGLVESPIPSLPCRQKCGDPPTGAEGKIWPLGAMSVSPSFGEAPSPSLGLRGPPGLDNSNCLFPFCHPNSPHSQTQGSGKLQDAQKSQPKSKTTSAKIPQHRPFIFYQPLKPSARNLGHESHLILHQPYPDIITHSRVTGDMHQHSQWKNRSLCDKG